MKEGFLNLRVVVVAHQQPAKVARPRKGALDFPAVPVAVQRAPVLNFLFAAAPVRTDQLDALLGQVKVQAVAVVTAIGDEPSDLVPVPRCYSVERVLDERHFRRTGFEQLTSQRFTRLCPAGF